MMKTYTYGEEADYLIGVGRHDDDSLSLSSAEQPKKVSRTVNQSIVVALGSNLVLQINKSNVIIFSQLLLRRYFLEEGKGRR